MLEDAILAEKKRLWEQGKLEGLAEARLEARLEARRAGERECNLRVARLMLQNGEPIAKIKLYTGLPDEALRSLQAELQAS